MSRLVICLLAFGAFLVSDIWAAPRGGPSVGFGFGFGSPGGFYGSVGNVPPRYYGGYGGYYGRGYPGYYYDDSPGVYLGGRSSDFRWGVRIPLGDDDDYYYDRGYGYNRYYYPQPSYYSEDSSLAAPTPSREPPPLPTAGEVARLNDEQLRSLIAGLVDIYDQELNGFNTGAGWKKHFKLAELKTLVTAPQAGAPDSAAEALVAEIAEKFEDAAKDPTYEVITKPWGFQALHVALKEYALPAAERQVHVLNARLQTLKRSLDDVSTGAGWKAYLEIDALEKIVSQQPNIDDTLIKKLEKILQHFDSVAGDSQYKVVAEVKGFASTRTALQKFINAVQAKAAKQNGSTEPTEGTTGEVSL